MSIFSKNNIKNRPIFSQIVQKLSNRSKLALNVQKLSNRSKVVYKKKKRPENSLKSDYYWSYKNWRKGKISLSAVKYLMFDIVSKLVIQYGGEGGTKIERASPTPIELKFMNFNPPKIPLPIKDRTLIASGSLSEKQGNPSRTRSVMDYHFHTGVKYQLCVNCSHENRLFEHKSIKNSKQNSKISYNYLFDVV